MGAITLEQAARWCGGRIDPKYSEICFAGANNDSRKILPGQLFLALQGERDGHDYIPMALEKGAAAVLCTHCDGDYPAIVVEDTRIALGQIARGLRTAIGMQVVAVTGSVGKSTTKEMIACVLAEKYRVEKTPANHNNDIGMPMAVLDMAPDTQVAVLEMGMNHFREIAYLTNIGRPNLAVIINIGTMHIEHLGSQDGILQAKLEITEGMKPDGKLLLYGDDCFLQKAQSLVRQPITYFGTGANCQVLARDIREAYGKIFFQVSCDDESFPVVLPVEGLHHVPDALAAISVGKAMGVTNESIAHALANFQNMEGRQEIFEAKGFTVIKDCYNAGPESMAAALAVLAKKAGRKIAVLGDMLELGAHSREAHDRIGRIAAEKADILLTYGPECRFAVGSAKNAGMELALGFEDREDLIKKLKEIVKQGDVLLFKGSHGMHIELALEGFLKENE